MRQAFFLCLLCLNMAACVKAPPRHVDDVCKIFKEYPEWYRATKATAKDWHVPVPVQMAIIHQESRFVGDARPERTKLLWIIPWTRPSTALGYSQALDTTWSHYKRERGSWFASRSSFDDASDFIGWYARQARVKAGIPQDDAYRLYLAYHEGVGGYQRKTYLNKPWLIAVARKVKRRSQVYQQQLAACRGLGGWFWT